MLLLLSPSHGVVDFVDVVSARAGEKERSGWRFLSSLLAGVFACLFIVLFYIVFQGLSVGLFFAQGR